MDDLVSRSRWVQVAKSDGGFVVEANIWLDERKDAYTINIRGWGKTVEKAAQQCLLKIKSLE